MGVVRKMTEAPYPKRGGKGRPASMPIEIPGMRIPLLRPYGGMTYEEWMATPLKPSRFQKRFPNDEFADQEMLGERILEICRSTDRNFTASQAADLLLGT
jgi:hypothetical protein